jgi:hypothetical protein
MTRHPSDSSEQQAIERVILEALKKDLDCRFSRLPVDIGLRNGPLLDGFDPEKRILCEVYARVGQLKGSQPDKVASDMLKMLLVERRLGGEWRKILCFTDEVAARTVQGKSWLAETARAFDFEIRIVGLTADQRRLIEAAQKRQVMVNA